MVVGKSLAFRIISLSSIWIVFALVITAMLLVYFYRDHMDQHFDNHVNLHLEELIEASRYLPDGTFDLAFSPSDPRYHDLHSGWYWEVKQGSSTMNRSPSLGKNSLDTGDIQAGAQVQIHEISGPVNEQLRVHIIELRPDPQREPLLLMASAPATGFTDDVLNYSNHITFSFMSLGIGLLLVVVLQVQLALRPLKAISTGISRIREGKASKLPPNSLTEVQPLVDELNNLLDHNTVLLKRARNRLADLAHSVKNPLTVINNESRNMTDVQRELITQQTSEISRNIDHYLSRARAFGTKNILASRSSIREVADDIVYALKQIYLDRNLEFDTSQLMGCWFRGEGQDLEEMLGNLMDNACKWAENQVLVRCEPEQDRLILTVEDDGPGVSEENFHEVIRRGVKLDESISGHGQGLGIVNDIAELYDGSLTLGKSKLGGLKAVLNLPIAW